MRIVPEPTILQLGSQSCRVGRHGWQLTEGAGHGRDCGWHGLRGGPGTGTLGLKEGQQVGVELVLARVAQQSVTPQSSLGGAGRM